MRPEHRSLLRSLFNVTSVALSIWVAAHAFYWLAQASPGQTLALSQLVGPLFALAALYLDQQLADRFRPQFRKKRQRCRTVVGKLPWLSLNYFGGVSVAALLVSARSIDINTIGIILPLLVITYLTYKTSLARLADAQRHIAQVNDLYLSTIETLAMAVDAKIKSRMGTFVAFGVCSRTRATAWRPRGRSAKAIETAALLHDMGKLAIPEHILNKPGKLTTAEFATMKQHADIGADLLSSIRFPYPVVPIVRHHHESWNGTVLRHQRNRYPIGGEILSVVDCFDALTSDRPYRPRLSKEEAFSILRDRSGVMCDPLVVDTFIGAFDEIAPAAIKAGQLARASRLSMKTPVALEETVSRHERKPGATQRSRWLTKARRVGSIDAAVVAAFALVRQFTPASVCACLIPSTSGTVIDVLVSLGIRRNCCAV